MSVLRSAFLAAALLFISAGASSMVESAARPYNAVGAFDGATYCESVDRNAPIEKPASVMAVLDSKNPQVDGYAIADAVLISAAFDIAHASADPDSCRTIFKDGERRFESVFDASLERIRKGKKHRFDREEPVRSIQQNITRLWQYDQAGRAAYLALKSEDMTGANFWAARLSVANASRIDEESKRYLETVLQDHVWVDSKRFGKVYADHAWILVQHADDYPAFQAQVLERMRPLIGSGGVRPRHYAYLFDRVAVNTGKPQKYGTQPIWDCKNGRLELAPLDDPANVNTRRAAMGMGTVEAALDQMSQEVCGS